MNGDRMTVEEMTAELESLRPLPAPEFASRLDARAAAGFPGRRPANGLRAAGRRLRPALPRRPLLPALAGVATVVVVATAVVVSSGDGGSGDSPMLSPGSGGASGAGGVSGGEGMTFGGEAAKAPQLIEPAEPGAVGADMTRAAPVPPLPGPGAAPGVRKRQVERSAELTLGAAPEQVQGVAAEAIEVVGRHQGIVLSSSVRDGGEGDAGASFELLVPSRRLSAALSDLSAIAEVRSRSENTLDITAPFVSVSERLRDARAEAEGLLAQLAAADTESERDAVKVQLRGVRDRIAYLRAQKQRLERRANFATVSLRISSGDEAFVPGGAWTIDDALRDAGRVLTVAAGISLLAAAVLLPLALLGGGTWAARRIYLRRAREQTLGA